MADEHEYRVNIAIEVRDDFGRWLFTCHSQHTVKARRPMEAWRLAGVEAQAVCDRSHSAGNGVHGDVSVGDWALLRSRPGVAAYA